MPLSSSFFRLPSFAAVCFFSDVKARIAKSLFPVYTVCTYACKVRISEICFASIFFG